MPRISETSISAASAASDDVEGVAAVGVGAVGDLREELVPVPLHLPEHVVQPPLGECSPPTGPCVRVTHRGGATTSIPASGPASPLVRLSTLRGRAPLRRHRPLAARTRPPRPCTAPSSPTARRPNAARTRPSAAVHRSVVTDRSPPERGPAALFPTPSQGSSGARRAGRLTQPAIRSRIWTRLRGRRRSAPARGQRRRACGRETRDAAGLGEGRASRAQRGTTCGWSGRGASDAPEKARSRWLAKKLRRGGLGAGIGQLDAVAS